MILSSSVTGIYAQEFETETMVNQDAVSYAISKIESIELCDVVLESSKALYDVNGSASYILLNFENGYAIVESDSGAISQYSLESASNPYSEFTDEEKWYYAGPMNYLHEEDMVEIQGNVEIYAAIAEQNEIFLSTAKEADAGISAMATNSWVGLPAPKMKAYASGKWVNSAANYPSSSGYPSGGICGTIASAGLLAYYDDYINDSYVPASIRSRKASTPGSLITSLYPYIDQGKSGTINSDLSKGINNFLSRYTSGTKTATYGGISTFPTAKSKIDDGCPVAIGLLSTLGSTYGNHWALVYQYYDDSSSTSNDLYRCVDNHGNYSATINVSWSAGIVWMNEARGNIAVERVYNPNSGEHVYTIQMNEVQGLVNSGWTYEGEAWSTTSSGSPIYRLYNPNTGEHHYTKSDNEKNYLSGVGWKYEKVAWYYPTNGSTNVYRLYNPNKTAFNHHYTTSANERSYLISIGWTDEGVAWKAL